MKSAHEFQYIFRNLPEIYSSNFHAKITIRILCKNLSWLVQELLDFMQIIFCTLR